MWKVKSARNAGLTLPSLNIRDALCVTARRRSEMSAAAGAGVLKQREGETLEETLRTLADEFEAKQQEQNRCPDVYLNVYDMVCFDGPAHAWRPR